MHVDTEQLDGNYPKEPECTVNSNDCSFTPIHSLCHECGRELCADCAVGVRHQPTMFKYTRIGQETDERVQMHCPACADEHGFNTTVLAAGGGGVALGALILGLGASSAIAILIGLVLLSVGGYLLYNEYQLKEKLDVGQLGSDAA